MAPARPASELLGSVCLSIFLAWTMMALDLATVFSLAGPLVIILLAQLVQVAMWAYFVTSASPGATTRVR
jgi:ESS family glutamate:Na+ symporter